MSTFETQTAEFHALRSQFSHMPRLSPETYADAVEVLRLAVHLFASSRTGRTAAHVLLNAYQGAVHPMDTTDILYLDPDLQNAALIVLLGRIKLNYEPHLFYNKKDAPYRGNEIFDRLAEYL